MHHIGWQNVSVLANEHVIVIFPTLFRFITIYNPPSKPIYYSHRWRARGTFHHAHYTGVHRLASHEKSSLSKTSSNYIHVHGAMAASFICMRNDTAPTTSWLITSRLYCHLSVCTFPIGPGGGNVRLCVVTVFDVRRQCEIENGASIKFVVVKNDRVNGQQCQQKPSESCGRCGKRLIPHTTHHHSLNVLHIHRPPTLFLFTSIRIRLCHIIIMNIRYGKCGQYNINRMISHTHTHSFDDSHHKQNF